MAQKTSDALQVAAGVGAEAAQAVGSNGKIAAQNLQDVANAAVAMKKSAGRRSMKPSPCTRSWRKTRSKECRSSTSRSTS